MVTSNVRSLTASLCLASLGGLGLLNVNVNAAAVHDIQTPLQQDLDSSFSSSSVSGANYNRTAALVPLYEKLLRVESLSGNEHDIGIFLGDWLELHGFSVRRQIVPPLPSNPKDAERYNILAWPKSGDEDEFDEAYLPSPKVILSSHLDTVPPYIPPVYSPGNNSFFGRGTADDKNCIAAQITALNELLYSEVVAPQDVALMFVVGEEVGGDGMRHASDGLINRSSPPKAVIFGEPTELKLATGHKGAVIISVEAHGKAAHSGYPWLGESAVSMILPALLAIDRLELPGSKLLGNSTINIGRIDAGAASNVVPEKARADMQIRLGAGTKDGTLKKITKIAKDVDERIQVIDLNGYGPVTCDVDVEGFETMSVNYGTDIYWLEGQHKRYLYGPGSILLAHSERETVKVEDLLTSVDGYKKLVKHGLSL